MNENRADLEARIRQNVGAQAAADQIEARWSEVDRLAPAENNVLMPNDRYLIDHTLSGEPANRDEVNVYRLHRDYGSLVPDDGGPLPRAVVESCDQCLDPTKYAVMAFWLRAGVSIIEMLLCDDCAQRAVFDHGAIPKTV